MDVIYIYKNAEFDNNRFVVHEVAHAYENATKHWLGAKPGRAGITESLWWRVYPPDEDYGGFAGEFDDWQFSHTEGAYVEKMANGLMVEGGFLRICSSDGYTINGN
jgi:hypothetical protein